MTERDPAHSYGELLFLCCGVTFACYFGSYLRVPVVPLFALSLGADAVAIGFINSAFLLTAGILCLPLGMLSDRSGRKLLILCGLAIASLSSFVLCLSKTPLQMGLVYGLFGVGLAAFAPTMMSYIADISPPTHVGRSYGWYTMAMYGGMSLGPALGGMAAQAFGFQLVFIISGAFTLVMFWVVLFRLPRARLVLHSKSVRSRFTAGAARQLLKNRLLIACWLVTLGGCFALGMFVTFVPLHAAEQGVDLAEIGLIFASQALMNALSRIPFGHLSDRVADRSILAFFGLLAYAAAIAGVGLSRGILTFLLSAGAMGIGMGIAFTAVGALISEVVPPASRGLAMGGYNTCIYLGMMFSSAVMGTFVKAVGFQSSFFIAASFTALTACFFQVVFRKARKKGTGSIPEDL